MRRVVAVFGVMLAVMTVTAPTAGAVTPHRGFVFYTHADGFYVEGRSVVGSGHIRLLLDRHGETAYYYVGLRVGAGTVRARFGRLGSVDLRFVPARETGPLGCGDEEGGWQAGHFRGAIVFRGEHHYADVDAGSARGWFATLPRERCGADRAHASRSPSGRASRIARASRSAPTRQSRIGPIAETGARLTASTSSRFPGIDFYADPYSRRENERVVNFGAFRDEKREGMTIERGVQVLGGARSFEWDLGTGTARVEPPAPFTGRGFYRRGADGRPPRWAGSLRFPILGGKPMRLTGAAFAAHLGSGT